MANVAIIRYYLRLKLSASTKKLGYYAKLNGDCYLFCSYSLPLSINIKMLNVGLLTLNARDKTRKKNTHSIEERFYWL